MADETGKPKPENGSTSPQRSTFTPSQRISSRGERAERLSRWAIGGLIVAAIAPIIFLGQSREPDQVIVLGADGTIHIGALENLGDDSALFREILLQATKAMFDRSAVGIESREMVAKLFSNSAITRLNKDVEWEMPYLTSREIRSWALPSEITPLKNENGRRVYRVAGTLTVAGNYKGTPIAATDSFVVVMVLDRNPRFGDQARYPFIVTDFRILEPKRPDNLK